MVRRPLLLLSAAALAPIALGIAMHLEHVAAAEACTADLDAWTAMPTTSSAPADASADSIVPRSMPIPVPIAEPITDHAMPFAFVVDVEGPHIVLATTIDERWIDGPPRFRGRPNDEEHYAILDRNVAIAQLPPEVLAAVGRRMRVYSADGEVCTARIGMPQLVGELWGDLYEFGPEESQGMSPEQQSWEVSRRTLVAPLATDGECGSPQWARDAALPAPAVFTRTDGHVPKTARKALLADPGVRDYARDMRQAFEEVRDADETTPIPTLMQRSVGQRWQDARGHEVFTLTFTGDEFGGCGGFEVAWSAFVPTDGGGVTAIDRAGDDVLAVVDLDRDGRVEVLTTTWMGPTRLVEIGGADALEERASLGDVPFFGCPC
jgi:hypothetical protein